MVHNFNTTGAPQSVGSSPGTGFTRGGGMMNPPVYNRPLATPSIFAQTAALRRSDPRYRTEPR